MSYTDKEPSCAKCAYAYWDRSFDGETHEVDIGCKYPLFGDLGRYQDRDDIIFHWHDDTIEYAQECESFCYAADIEDDVMIAVWDKNAAKQPRNS